MCSSSLSSLACSKANVFPPESEKISRNIVYFICGCILLYSNLRNRIYEPLGVRSKIFCITISLHSETNQMFNIPLNNYQSRR